MPPRDNTGQETAMKNTQPETHLGGEGMLIGPQSGIPLRPFDSGIHLLNRALGELRSPGHLLGVIGCTGAGKTVLAAQFARHAITAKPARPVLYLAPRSGRMSFITGCFQPNARFPPTSSTERLNTLSGATAALCQIRKSMAMTVL